MIKKIINLPTNDSKIYKQILAFLNFSLEATPQEREVLAEIIQLNNEYEALPAKQRAKFLLSTDMRKEMREKLSIEEKQFNVILSRIKKKTIFGQPVFDDDGIISNHLVMKPDNEGLRIEINLINTINKSNKTSPIKKEEEGKEEEMTIIPTVDSDAPKKLAAPANGTDNIIYEDELPSGFVILGPNGE